MTRLRVGATRLRGRVEHRPGAKVLGKAGARPPVAETVNLPSGSGI